MTFESLLPFFLLLFPFVLAFLIEALVLWRFGVAGLGKAFGISVLLNVVSLAVVFYVVPLLLKPLGYDLGQFNGLSVPLPVGVFLWWFSAVAEGFLLSAIFRKLAAHKLFTATALMNALSFLFLYIFVLFSH